MRQQDKDEAVGRSRPSLRELEVLRAVMATRKTTAAAQRLGISQPAVSRALASLEHRVGRPLFTRDGGRLLPTADAFALDADANPIFAILERLDAWPKSPHAGALLRLAAPPTISQWFLAPLLARFTQIEPETRIQIEIARGGDVVSLVADGGADLGLIDSVVGHPGVRVEIMRRSVAHAVLWSDHPLASRRKMRAQDLAGEPLALLSRRFPSRARVEQAFGDAGITPRIVLEATTSSFAVEMVRARVALAVVNPFPLTLSAPEGLVFIPFEPAIPYETALLTAASVPTVPAARRFADFLRTEQPDDPYTTALR